jgi:hypothetical protein
MSGGQFRRDVPGVEGCNEPCSAQASVFKVGVIKICMIKISALKISLAQVILATKVAVIWTKPCLRRLGQLLIFRESAQADFDS